jgi:hypothetical protein
MCKAVEPAHRKEAGDLLDADTDYVPTLQQLPGDSEPT